MAPLLQSATTPSDGPAIVTCVVTSIRTWPSACTSAKPSRRASPPGATRAYAHFMPPMVPLGCRREARMEENR
jgi:hypothetical protein